MSGYQRINFKDQNVERPKTYDVTNNPDGSITLIESFGNVEELGTPINQDNMNHIEDGIDAVSFSKFSLESTYKKNDLVTDIQENELKIFKSLKENNFGHLPSETDYWEEVEFSGAGGSGLQLFDTILKDHILTEEESKGLALQGTYVYKEAVAGSRYGYPDFYNECLKQYQESSDAQCYAKSNVDVIGTIADRKGVLSGFTGSNYVSIPVKTPTTSFELVIKTHTPTSFAENSILESSAKTQGIVFRCVSATSTQVWMSSNGTSWDICSSFATGLALPLDSDVWIKVSWDGATYKFAMSTNGTEWTEGNSKANVNPIYWATGTQNLGACDWENYPWTGGTIDLNDSYLNIDGERYWTGVNILDYKANANGHQFYDIANKSIIDEIYNSTGLAWYYGIDEENERILMPRKNLLELTPQSKVPVVGDGMALGLFDGTYNTGLGSGTIDSKRMLTSLPELYGVPVNTAFSGGPYGASSVSYGVTTDPDKSGIETYLNEHEAQNQYLYICVGNTTSTSSITDVVDITTTENDTIPLGYSVYRNTTQASVSWLKSEGQWNDGNIYKTFYNEFLKKIGEDFAKGKVVSYKDSYTDFDLVINEDDITFRLPLYDGSEWMSSKNYVDLELGESGSNYIAPANGWYYINKSGTEAGQRLVLSVVGGNVSSYNTYSVSAGRPMSGSLFVQKGDEVKVTYELGGILSYFRFYYATGNGSLYFKVANAVENLELLDAGEVLEAVSKVVPNNSELITTFCCPDWTNMITVSSTPWTIGTYTAPVNGLMIFDITLYAKIGYITVNGIDITRRTGTGTHMTDFSYALPVSKNDIVTFYNGGYDTVGYTSQTVKFVPAKGVK